MTKTVFSLKTLAGCWAGLLAVLGSGAVALQLTTPPQPPVIVAHAAAAEPTHVEPAAPIVQAVTPAALPAVLPLPFENRSLVALLPPAVHPVPPVSARLPVPPIPPVRRVAHVEPHRSRPVYAAQPAYDPYGWARAMPYPGMYVGARPYAYEGPRTYYGW